MNRTDSACVPYSKDPVIDPLTYGDVPATGGEGHDVGEIWSYSTRGMRCCSPTGTTAAAPTGLDLEGFRQAGMSAAGTR